MDKKTTWTEKYRPSTLDDIVNNDNIIKTICNMRNNHCMLDLMFYGPPGSGKTSTILAFGKDLYGKNFNLMTMIMNASDSGRIDNIRNQIKDFISLDQRSICKVNYPFKLIILDEVDAMSHDAQIVLQKLMEENHRTTLFCLICNYHNKIIRGLVSRCALFRFRPLSEISINKKIDEIIKNENIKISKKSIDILINISKGDMRKVLNIMHSCYLAYGNIIKKNHIYITAGICDPDNLNLILIYLLQLYHKNIELKYTVSSIEKIINQHNINMFLLIEFLYETLEKIDFSNSEMEYFIEQLAELENNLTISGDHQKVDHLCSIFVLYEQPKI